jgi:methionyl-tRNA formyltransferase
VLLETVGMLAADTSRSRAYLSALIRNDLLPSHVYVLPSASKTSLPGQGGGSSRFPPIAEDCWSEADFDPAEPLEDIVRKADLAYTTLPGESINSPDVVEVLRGIGQPVLIYSGYGGALLGKDALATGKMFLHVHGGYLPDYKGSTTNYYSLIADNRLGASSLFLNEEIDSGPVLLRQTFPPAPDRLAIDHIYDSAARAKVLVLTLRRYLELGDWEFALPDNRGGETFYIIHPVLKHIAIMGRHGE